MPARHLVPDRARLMHDRARLMLDRALLEAQSAPDPYLEPYHTMKI
jgi:hypothetical protein